MRLRLICFIAALAFVPALSASAKDGLITQPSNYSAAETLQRLENEISSRGFKIFGKLDHAAAAKDVDLEMPFSTVLVFGNPKLGTPSFILNPKLAIDLPLKALVWEVIWVKKACGHRVESSEAMIGRNLGTCLLAAQPRLCERRSGWVEGVQR